MSVHWGGRGPGHTSRWPKATATPTPTPTPSGPSVAATSTFGEDRTGFSNWTVLNAVDLSNCDAAIAIVAVRTGTVNPTITVNAGSTSGWALIGTGTTFGGNIGGYSCVFGVFRKIAPTASETLIVDSASNGIYGCVLYRTTGVDTVAQAGANATTGNANPPNLDTGAARDTIWISVAALAAAAGPTALPANYADEVTYLNGATLALATGRRSTSLQTEDPGAFTNATARWGAKTIALYHS